jgi:polar amino acid transport system permease protein
MSGLLDHVRELFGYYNVLFILKAMGRTLAMTLVGCSFGFAFGLLLALIRHSTRRSLQLARVAAATYVEMFRRIPFLVILFVVLFGIQPFAPRASLFTIATVSVCLLAAAMLSEIIRAGLNSVPEQQVQAAQALNLGYLRTLRFVVFPLAWKVIIPPAIAFAVMFIKDTALASYMGVAELTFTGKVLVTRGIPPALGFAAILMCYFVLSYPLMRLGGHLERRLATPRN